MSQVVKPVEVLSFHFWLNPNVVPHVTSGFRQCFAEPWNLEKIPEEYALTEPSPLSEMPAIQRQDCTR